MYGVNTSIPKTLIRHVVRYFADVERSMGEMNLSGALYDILDTPVSPELLPAKDSGEIAQITEDLVGPYELHDFFLWNFIVNEMGSADLRRAASAYFGGRYDEATVAKTCATFMRRFFTQAFKRNCQPDGVRVFPFELSLRGWWIPSDLGPVDL